MIILQYYLKWCVLAGVWIPESGRKIRGYFIPRIYRILNLIALFLSLMGQLGYFLTTKKNFSESLYYYLIFSLTFIILTRLLDIISSENEIKQFLHTLETNEYCIPRNFEEKYIWKFKAKFVKYVYMWVIPWVLAKLLYKKNW